ncbi:hypothetical protein ACGFS9_17410 [Streptomyces sp. NPDC048566]|uniref:hypothetical protein n=1 Tax=Streptomyces sp. NPDC048566 TaxID=3365569 RepID=UPI0037181F0D
MDHHATGGDDRAGPAAWLSRTQEAPMQATATIGVDSARQPHEPPSTEGTRTPADAREAAPEWRELGLSAMSALLVVSLSHAGRHSFRAVCQWPRWHPLNERALAVTHHPLLLVESTRQLAALAQARCLPAAESPPRLRPVSVALGTDPRTRPVETGAATEVAVRVTMSDVSVASGALTGYRITAEYFHADRRFGVCAMVFAAAQPPAVDAGTGSFAGLLHPAPAAVGAAAEPDVLVARAPQGRLLIVPRDGAHPVLLPGGPAELPLHAVLEAGRQATLLYQGRPPSAVVGLAVRSAGAVPGRGAAVDVVPEENGARFVVLDAGRAVASGTVTLAGP